jgi:glycine cleavage system H protein
MRILDFDYPDDCFYFLERDMWCRAMEDGRMQVGVTSFGIHLSGDFYMCRPKPPGTVVAQAETLGVAELSKSIVAIKTPVSGTVVQVNPLLEETPEVIHQQPYGRGWLAVIEPSQWHTDLARLAHGAPLEAAAIQRMQLENLR